MKINEIIAEGKDGKKPYPPTCADTGEWKF
jgi:hypothetical protein